jgi:hypothetical protein
MPDLWKFVQGALATDRFERQQRRTLFEDFAIGALLVSVPIAIWLGIITQTEGFIFFGTAAILYSQYRAQRRLKAMQLRLAWMHDTLDRVAGLEPKHHLETEKGAES